MGQERCFVVRSVEVGKATVIEGAASAPVCVTPVDRFPPAAPSGLHGDRGGGGIDLSWTAVDAADLAGYIVLRGEGAGGTLQPLMATPDRRDAVSRHAACVPASPTSTSSSRQDKPRQHEQSNRIADGHSVDNAARNASSAIESTTAARRSTSPSARAAGGSSTATSSARSRRARDLVARASGCWRRSCRRRSSASASTTRITRPSRTSRCRPSRCSSSSRRTAVIGPGAAIEAPAWAGRDRPRGRARAS